MPEAADVKQQVPTVDEALEKILGKKDFTKTLYQKVTACTRSGGGLPSGHDYSVQTALPQVSAKVDRVSTKTVTLLKQSLSLADDQFASRRATPQVLASNYEVFEDSVDNICDTIDDFLKPPSKEEKQSHIQKTIAHHKDRISKPQRAWKSRIDNYRPRYVPIDLKTKLNAKFPLHPGIAAALKPDAPRCETPLPHPYEEEIRALKCPQVMLDVREPQVYGTLEDTPLINVDSKEALRAMVDELKTAKEIAIDLEHHDFHSYRGFTCLIQVSTRKKDWVVDPFDLFPHLHMLNEVTTDPNIVKVLHGADRDIIWLQRDFSVFIVNMFDTGQATRVLELGGGASLNNLVNFYCGVQLEKKYQRADWRTRPLPEEMVQYARLDTHYLLYLYDKLLNALLTKPDHPSQSESPNKDTSKDKNKVTASGLKRVQQVYENSQAIASEIHTETDSIDAEAEAEKICKRNKQTLKSSQFAVLTALAEWRDRVARHQDESPSSILGANHMFRIASKHFKSVDSVTPEVVQGIINPCPQSIRDNAKDIVRVIKRHLTKIDLKNDKKVPVRQSSDIGQHKTGTKRKMDDSPDRSSTIESGKKISVNDKSDKGGARKKAKKMWTHADSWAALSEEKAPTFTGDAGNPAIVNVSIGKPTKAVHTTPLAQALYADHSASGDSKKNSPSPSPPKIGKLSIGKVEVGHSDASMKIARDVHNSFKGFIDCVVVHPKARVKDDESDGGDSGAEHQQDEVDEDEFHSADEGSDEEEEQEEVSQAVGSQQNMRGEKSLRQQYEIGRKAMRAKRTVNATAAVAAAPEEKKLAGWQERAQKRKAGTAGVGWDLDDSAKDPESSMKKKKKRKERDDDEVVEISKRRHQQPAVPAPPSKGKGKGSGKGGDPRKGKGKGSGKSKGSPGSSGKKKKKQIVSLL
jgi:ribonuclease D